MPRITHSIQALSVAALIALSGPALATGLDARASSVHVAQGDSFQLMLSGDPATMDSGPDLSPLAADFDVLGTSQSQQTRIINGKRSDSLQWIVTLSPKAMGRVMVPAIHAGQISSEPFAIDVLDPAKMPVTRQPGAPEITVSAADGAHYVQQEIPLTVRITSGPNLRSASLELPQSADFTLTQSGEDQITRSQVNGQPVTVLERKLMLRPQKDGAITLPPLTLRAIVNAPGARSPFANSPFQDMFSGSMFGGGAFGGGLFGKGGADPFADMFNSGHEIAVRSAPLTLEIKSDPSGQNSWFLPAKKVELSAKWRPETPHFKAGEGVTRVIQIMALGATAVQLPDLEMPETSGAKLYLDGSDTRNADTAEGTAALREFRYSVVPSHGGEITLPEIRLQWFNTTTETTETAVLPAQTITVEGPPTAAKPATPAASAAISTPAKTTPEPKARGFSTLQLSMIGTAFLAFGTGLLWWLWPRNTTHAQRDIADRRAALKRAEKAAASAELKALYQAASDWLKITAGSRAPQKVLQQDFPDLSKNWAALEARLFARNPANDAEWQPRNFIAALRFANAVADARYARKQPRLRPLYTATTPT